MEDRCDAGPDFDCGTHCVAGFFICSGERLHQTVPFYPVLFQRAQVIGDNIVDRPCVITEKPFAGKFRGPEGAMQFPVVIAGGSKKDAADTLRTIQEVMQAGAAGLSMGRNAFQHRAPEKFVRAACMIVHEGKDAETALRFLKGEGD